MSQSDIQGSIRPRKPYASNSILAILKILWQHTYTGHGWDASQIYDELKRDLGEFAPTDHTVRNQLNALEGQKFLGRQIHKLDPNNKEDAAELEGATKAQAGWRMSTFLSPAEARLLSDSLALSRISQDAMSDMLNKLNGLVGGIKLSTNYLTTTSAKDRFNGEFLSSIKTINEAIVSGKSITFRYANYDRSGKPVPRLIKDTNEPRRYHVDPYQMVFKNGRYYLVCASHGHPERQLLFCIDRLIQPEPSAEAVQPRKQPFDAIAYMRERPYPVTDEVTEIVMFAQPAAFNYIFDWFDNPQIIGPTPHGWYQVTAKSPIKAAYWWALQYADAPVVIAKPTQLCNQLAQAGCQLLLRYGRQASQTESK